MDCHISCHKRVQIFIWTFGNVAQITVGLWPCYMNYFKTVGEIERLLWTNEISCYLNLRLTSKDILHCNSYWTAIQWQNLVVVKHCWGLESLDIGFEVLNCPQIVTFPRRCDGFSIQPHGCELMIRQVLLSIKGPSKSVWVSDVDQTRYIFSR